MREPMAMVLQETANAIGERPRDRRLERVENIGTSHCGDCTQGERCRRARARGNCKVGSGCWTGGDSETESGRVAKAVVVFVQMGGMWLREVAEKPTTNQEEHRKVAAKRTRIQALACPTEPGAPESSGAQPTFNFPHFPAAPFRLCRVLQLQGLGGSGCATVSPAAATPLSHARRSKEAQSTQVFQLRLPILCLVIRTPYQRLVTVCP